MAKKPKTKRGPRRFLRLTDLDHAKRTVVNTLGSAASARAYTNAIDDFIDWYSSEPRLDFIQIGILDHTARSGSSIGQWIPAGRPSISC
jgi:hypothetical protein